MTSLGSRPDIYDPRRRAPRPQLRVLVEGPDMCGKTTLARSLSDELNRQRIDTRYAQGYWRQRNLVYLAVIFASRRPRLLGRLYNPLCYLASWLDDALPRGRAAREATVLVLESYIDRAIAYDVAVNRTRTGNAVRRFAAHAFPTFDVVIVVTAPLEVRRERMAERRDPSLTDRVTTATSAAHTAYQQTIVELTARHRRQLVLDTSTLSREEVLAAALDLVHDSLGDGAGS